MEIFPIAQTISEVRRNKIETSLFCADHFIVPPREFEDQNHNSLNLRCNNFIETNSNSEVFAIQ